MPNRTLALAFLAPLSAAVLALTASLGTPAFAQDDTDDAPPPPRKKEGVQITFLPPPMQGTLSLGIYDAGGKLVRVLHREATEKDFVIGLNGLITRWDGKDDQGAAVPDGRYRARGWMVGELDVEGVAFHGNDWITEDGPRVAEALRFEKGDSRRWHVVLRAADGSEHSMPVTGEEPELAIDASGEQKFPVELPEGEKVVKWTAGFGGNLWAIVETPAGREVRSYAPGGEFLRRLAYREDEPAPFDLAASTAEETVLLLEKNAREQRFRILGQPEVKGEASAWKTIDQKRIVASDTFASVAQDLGRAEPPKPEPVVKISSKLNPLLQNARVDLQAQAIAGPDGAILATADGLPLLQLSQAKGLKWCALVPEGKALTLFEGDGVVVEEFKIAKPGNVMSFDAGEYTLKK